MTKTALCWARCRACRHDFSIGCVVPCPVSVYLAALKAASCPICGTGAKGLDAWEPGRQPPAAAAGRIDLEAL